MADRAFITPNVLKWARESAKMSEETAAAKVSVAVEKLQAWEAGSAQPTIRQAQTLAKAYKRPFALFFLPEVPRDFQPLQDFRKAHSAELTTSSVFIIREIQQKQAWISEVYQDNNEEKLDFVGRFSTADAPEQVAQDILNTLQINPAAYRTDNPIREWITAAESKGIFVSRTSFIHSKMKLDSNELQGFAIADPYAPFVFLNSDDWSAPQLFTLVHELAHIWIAATGISNGIEPDILRREQYADVELFCNDVAANALIPTAAIRNVGMGIYNSAPEVFKTAKKMGVSTFAFLVRALKLNLISLPQYQLLKKQADADYQFFLAREEEKKAAQKLKQKENPGGPNPYLLRLNKNSRLFTQVVLDLFRSGSVQPTQASFLLGTPASNFYKLESQIYK
jgi:Zn-dependent peptidase ImmA (M78 family)/DNA-binding XRE family transcriptional regulator